MFFYFTLATGSGNHRILCCGTRTGRPGWDVLQQLLPLPALSGGREWSYGSQPMGAQCPAGPAKGRSAGHLAPAYHRPTPLESRGRKKGERQSTWTVLHEEAARPGIHPDTSIKRFCTPWLQTWWCWVAGSVLSSDVKCRAPLGEGHPVLLSISISGACIVCRPTSAKLFFAFSFAGHCYIVLVQLWWKITFVKLVTPVGCLWWGRGYLLWNSYPSKSKSYFTQFLWWKSKLHSLV